MERTARDLYACVGLGQIPHILSMVDANPLSPTYGCFDRSYWHYKTSPFPSGMYQEFVLPVALVYRFRFPGGEAYHGQDRLLELAAAAIRYAARSSHRDGSCDDYFPYERALGAAAFSLYASTESYLILGLEEEEMVFFFRKRARWLMEHQESGRLSNHQALVALALYNTYEISRDPIYLEGANGRLGLLLSWQKSEGWFPEYDGCDPGYLTATIDFLAKYYRKSGNAALLGPLRSAIRFAVQLMHPDGSYGGEHGSRNTYLFFPHGFELMAAEIPEAAHAAELYLEGVLGGHRVHLDDDRLCAHLTGDHLQAYLDSGERGQPVSAFLPSKGDVFFPEAGLLIHRDSRRFCVVSSAKGGVLRLHTGRELAYKDSGLIARLSDGTTLVSHLAVDVEVVLLEDGVQVEGHFGHCRFRLPTPLTQAVFHIGMLLIGRYGSDLVRRRLQRLLIVGKKRGPMRFKRTVRFGSRVSLVDEIWLLRRRRRSARVEALYAGSDHTSIYVAVSHCYQSGKKMPWTNYGEHLDELNANGYVRIERVIG